MALALPATVAIAECDVVVVNATVHPLSPANPVLVPWFLFNSGVWPFIAVAFVVGLAVGVVAAGLLFDLRGSRSGASSRPYWPTVLTWALVVAIGFAGAMFSLLLNAASSGL